MPRELNTKCLDGYARQFAVWWIQGYMTGRPERDREWLKQEFYRFTFKDTFDYLRGAVRKHLTGDDLDTFNAAIDDLLAAHPRSDEVFHGLLAKKLAIDPDGKHISGKVGTTQIGTRDVGKRINMHGNLKAARWPVYAGEAEERRANSSAVDPLPEPNQVFRNDEHKMNVEDAKTHGVKFREV